MNPACLFTTVLLVAGIAPAALAGSLRFHGFGASGVDRVKIPIDDPANLNDEPGPPVDVGAADFTIEFWIKGFLAQNSSGTQNCGGDGWIYGHIVIDRDRWEPGGRDYGISIAEGRVGFGCANESFGDTVCGSTTVLDGDWHHVAVDRRLADGRMRIFIDGVLDASADGPDGDISYPGTEVPQGENCGGGPCVNSDPFVVFGAEKHDAGGAFPSFSGWLDEVRFSRVLRYAGNFVPSNFAFVPDTSTAALYHFDEGTGDFIGDSSEAAGGPSHGTRHFGGAPVPGPEWSTDSPFAEATSARAAPAQTASAGQALPAKTRLVFEVHPNPSLGQTFFFVRCSESRGDSFRISIVDVAGREAARIDGALVRGSALSIWDGRGADGTMLRAGVYFAKLSTLGIEMTEKIVVR